MAEKRYAPGTCGCHAQMMLALMHGKPVGPKTKALVERFMSTADERCIADESQVTMLFGAAFASDTGGLTGEPEPRCSARLGDESSSSFHTYSDGCDRRHDP